MLNTKQANTSKLHFMHCNIENNEAQTDFSFSLFLTSRIKGPLEARSDLNVHCMY